MTPLEYLELLGLVFIGTAAYAVRKFRKEQKARRAEGRQIFVHDPKEFLSVWALAHEWEGLDPTTTDPKNVPLEIRGRIDKVVLAFFRKELGLRTSDGYRLFGHHWFEKLLGLDKEFDQLFDCLTNGAIDVPLLSGLYAMRSEVLKWCALGFQEPPPCWAPALPATPAVTEDSDEDHQWYEALTEQRRKKVACLEIARRLWEEDRTRSYADVFNHPSLAKSGFRGVFTSLESFKEWARDFAPDEAKKPGRRSKAAI